MRVVQMQQVTDPVYYEFNTIKAWQLAKGYKAQGMSNREIGRTLFDKHHLVTCKAKTPYEAGGIHVLLKRETQPAQRQGRVSSQEVFRAIQGDLTPEKFRGLSVKTNGPRPASDVTQCMGSAAQPGGHTLESMIATVFKWPISPEARQKIIVALAESAGA